MSIFQRIYETTRKIPQGKVTTYGEIARKLNISPRTVGWALHANKNIKVPCHRVVNKEGRIAKNYGFGGGKEQRRRLEREGVKFKKQYYVDFLWFRWGKIE